MSSDYLFKALVALRGKYERGETRFCAPSRRRLNLALESLLLAIDAAGPRIDENLIMRDVRDTARACMGALFVFELNEAVVLEDEDRLVGVIEGLAIASRKLAKAAQGADA